MSGKSAVCPFHSCLAPFLRSFQRDALGTTCVLKITCGKEAAGASPLVIVSSEVGWWFWARNPFLVPRRCCRSTFSCVAAGYGARLRRGYLSR